MKKTIILFSIFIVACSKPLTNRDKAIEVIKEYVKANNLADYENIEYSKLDSAYEYPDTLDIKIEQLRGLIAAEQQDDSMLIQTDTNDTEIKNTIAQYKKTLNSLLATPKQKHYYISDKNRTKNKMGTLEVNTINYEMDTTFKIIDTN
jgi:PBP1b-binding outer membrane lipoprotein LpoB